MVSSLKMSAFDYLLRTFVLTVIQAVAQQADTTTELTVDPPVRFAREGSTVTFTATGSGTNLPLQWYFGGPISGATNVSLTVANVEPSDEGFYWVQGTEGFRTVHATASLTICSAVEVVSVQRNRISPSAKLTADGAMYDVASTMEAVVAGSTPHILAIEYSKMNSSGEVIWKGAFATDTNHYLITPSYTISLNKGLFITASEVERAAPRGKLLLMRISPAGNLEWVQRYPTLDSGADWDSPHPAVLAEDKLGNIYLPASLEDASTNSGSLKNPFSLTKLDPTGKPIWSTRPASPVYPWCATVDSYDNVGLSGVTQSTAETGAYIEDILTVKINAEGEPFWAARYTLMTMAGVYSILADDSDNFLVNAFQWNYEGLHENRVTLKYSSEGKKLGEARPLYTRFVMSSPAPVALDKENNLYVAYAKQSESEVFRGSREILRIEKFSPAGTRLWTYRHALDPYLQRGFTTDWAQLRFSTNGQLLIKVAWHTNAYYQSREATGSLFIELVENRDGRPYIKDHSQNVIAIKGQPFTIAADVAGIEPIGFQWLLNQRTLPNETNRVISVPAADARHMGTYMLTATNAIGCAVSEDIYVRVATLPPPATLEIVSPPQPPAGAYRSISLRVLTEGSRYYASEASTNLIDWVPTGSHNSPEPFYQSANLPARFYRVYTYPETVSHRE
jgi:hypothetical protein